ncbi:MAG: AEC family transporter [Candidatus Kapabacteria bacterium]|nr:AEC family transporter [Candidatus Kapabacteria bacterium]
MGNVFATLGILLACGILYRRIPGVPDPIVVRGAIGSMVLNVFVPLLTFGVLVSAPLGSDIWTVPLVSISSVVVGFALSWIVFARLLRSRLSPPTIGALIISATWCNAMYLGLPITTAVIGDHVGRIPILFDYLGMTPLLFTLGTVVAVEYGTRGEKHTLGAGVLQALRMPPTIAVGVGLLANITHIPIAPFVLDACTAAGRVVAPLMLFSIGLALRWPRLSMLPVLAPVALIRLVIVPAVVVALAKFFIHDPDILRATMLESAMPTMMLTMVFAERYGLDESTLAQAILVTTLISVATLPIVAQWPF